MTDKILEATHQGQLLIGDNEIDCAVLEDGTRVISQTTFLRSLERSTRPPGGKGVSFENVPFFLSAGNLKPFINKDLIDSTNTIVFKPLKGGYKGISYGYDAKILPKVCYVYLDADKEGALHASQKKTVRAAEILVRGFATVGIIALIDEATGYQEVRDRLALQKILKLFIAKELLPWAKRFPDEFYEEMFRLRGWQYSPPSVKRPILVGKLTNDIVYDRLAPGVLKELKKITPKDDTGRHKHQLHRHLTTDVGHPKLSQHIHAVVALMKASSSWSQFKRLITRALPKRGDTLELPFDVD